MSKKYKPYEQDAEALERTLASRPDGYDASYADKANMLARSLERNAGSFSYNPESDAAYAAAKKQYTASAQRAMENVLGESAAMTGGYGNSWGSVAAQREYNSVMSGLGSVIPELYDAAYKRYSDERGELFDVLADYRDADDEFYSRGQDELAAWQDARDFYYDAARAGVEDQKEADDLELDLQKFIYEKLKTTLKLREEESKAKEKSNKSTSKAAQGVSDAGTKAASDAVVRAAVANALRFGR